MKLLKLPQIYKEMFSDDVQLFKKILFSAPCLPRDENYSTCGGGGDFLKIILKVIYISK
jgi:hypothetical protein